MTAITFLVPDGTMCIDGQFAYDVDFTGIDPEVRVLQWHGTGGWLEFHPVDGTHRLNEEITSLAPYQKFIDKGAALIQAQNNPSIVYFTEDTFYKGFHFKLGTAFSSTSVPPEIPPNTTTQQPPSNYKEDYTLYWHNSGWVLSVFPPSYTIQQARLFLKRQVETNAAELVNSQLRNASLQKILSTEDISSMYAADYLITHNYPTIGDFKEAVALARDNIIRDIDFAEDVTLLYRFNTQVRL